MARIKVVCAVMIVRREMTVGYGGVVVGQIRLMHVLRRERSRNHKPRREHSDRQDSAYRPHRMNALYVVAMRPGAS